MDFDLRWLFIAASLGLCAWAGWQFVHCLARARLLGDVPTSRIRSAAQGFVELYGVLEEGPEGPLQAPLTGKPCLWWRYRIEVEEKRSGREKAWRTVDKGASESPFGLRDATDACLVDPRGAEVRPLTQQRWEAFREAPIDTLRLLESFGTLVGGERLYRYTEERLHAGEPLYALGEFRSSGGGRQGLDAERAQGAVIREWKGDFHGLLARFDSDGNGELDEREWNRVRLAARLEAEDRHRASSAAPTRHRLGKPGEAHPFILSSQGEDDLAVQLRRQAAGAALLCLGSALLAGWLFSRPF
ncbi:TPA: GIDE domain-containing protein [Pseudomonas aeruginosa]